MNASTSPCDPTRLHRFVDQELAAAELAALEEHLSCCPVCRAALDGLVADARAWDDARASLAAEPERPAAGVLDGYRGLLGPTDDPRMMGRIGTYEVAGILGVGGMGVVFKAFDPALNRFVAIKVLAPPLQASPVAQQRFLREAQAAAAVLHDNVIAIHAIGHWRDAPYLVMTYVRGESLRRRLERRGSLSVREALRIGLQAAAGLAAAHGQGLIHRDVKPANILLETEVDRVKISDFGLARAVDDARLTQSHVVLGTPQYMSPEQAQDEPLDYRTDLFSLGTVLYEACAGRPPFTAATSYGVLRRIVEHRPPPLSQVNPAIPDWLGRVVARLMEKDRARRFASAAEVEAVLRQCLAHVEQPHLVPLPAAALGPRSGFSRVFHKQWRVLMAITTLGLLALGWALVTQTGPQERANPGPKPAQRGPAAGKGVRVGDYTVEVLGAGYVGNLEMTTEFDLSRVKMDQQGQQVGNAQAGGFVGGAGGGAGGTFVKPNLGIALRVEPNGAQPGTFAKLGSKVRVVDGQGNAYEAQDRGPAVVHFARFEERWPGAQFLYLHQGAGDDLTAIARLDGELVVTPGRRLTATFEGTQSQAKNVGKETFRLLAFQVTTTQHLQVQIAFPPLEGAAKGRTPQERFQAALANRDANKAVIEDDQGDRYPAKASMSTGGHGTVTFTFDALPRGRSVKAVHVSLEERTGEPKVLPFMLENVRLK